MVFHRKKKRFRLFVVPRYLPGSVTLQILYSDLARYNRHRYNIFLAKPKIDTMPPKMNPGLYLKTKKLIDDASRINEVDKENQAILKKINLINRTKGLVDCWNKLHYNSSKKWIAQQDKMKSIYLDNLHIYQSLNAAESIYKRDTLLRDWERIVEKLEYGSKYPLVLLQEKTLDQRINELPSISHDLDKLCVRPVVFIEFAVKDGVSLGKVIVLLYSDYAPVTVQNFLSIIKNDDGLCYKNCPIHNCVRGKYFITGDITRGNGKGGASIFGEKFAEESHTLLHTKPGINILSGSFCCQGVLSMIRVGDNENNSQFSITFGPMPKLDGKQVVFGKIIRGNKAIFQIDDLARRVGKPTVPIYIRDCGECIRHKSNVQTNLK